VFFHRLVKNISPRRHVTLSLYDNYIVYTSRFRFYLKSASVPITYHHWLYHVLHFSQGEALSLKRRFCNQKSKSIIWKLSTLEVADPAEWNSLPEIIRRSSSINTFKTELKTYQFSENYITSYYTL